MFIFDPNSKCWFVFNPLTGFVHFVSNLGLKMSPHFLSDFGNSFESKLNTLCSAYSVIKMLNFFILSLIMSDESNVVQNVSTRVFRAV